jgi:hypothetical protein
LDRCLDELWANSSIEVEIVDDKETNRDFVVVVVVDDDDDDYLGFGRH